jgi:hypothetical protein
MMPFGVHLLFLTLMLGSNDRLNAAQIAPDLIDVAVQLAIECGVVEAHDPPIVAEGDAPARLEELFEKPDVDDSSAETEPAEAIAYAYRSWDRKDVWERTLLALHAPESAIHFQDIIENARKERLADEQLALTTQRVHATSARRPCAYGATIDPVVWALAALAGLAVVFGVTCSLWSARGARRVRSDLEAREAALLLLASAIKAAEPTPWAGELRDHLRRCMREHPSSEYIRQLLRRHRSLRLQPVRTVDAVR